MDLELAMSVERIFTHQAGLEQIAKLSMQLLKERCPKDWQVLFPDLDFTKVDRVIATNSLAVLSYLPAMAEQTKYESQQLAQLLVHYQQHLHFNQTYTADDFGPEFLQQYGWLKLLGPDAYWHSDKISSGFVMFGDNVTYPEHWHVAEELYLPISGTADWYHEQHGWQTKQPGEVIYHASNVKHAIRTNGEPLLLMYVWRAGDLTQKSNIR